MATSQDCLAADDSDELFEPSQMDNYFYVGSDRIRAQYGKQHVECGLAFDPVASQFCFQLRHDLSEHPEIPQQWKAAEKELNVRIVVNRTS